MAQTFSERIEDLDEYALQLKDLIPAAASSFGALSRAAHTDGALERKTKELIALAISVATRCDGCIAYHARAVQRSGANRQEVGEMLAVTVQMGGGASYNTAADALRAYDEFADAARARHARHGVE